MSLPAYTTIYSAVSGNGPFQQRILVAIAIACNAVLNSTAPTQDIESVQNLFRLAMCDVGLVTRVGFRIINSIPLVPADSDIQTAVSALIPATGAFQL